MDFYVKNISGAEIHIEYTFEDGSKADDIFGPNEKIRIDSKKLYLFKQVLHLVEILPYTKINWAKEGF